MPSTVAALEADDSLASGARNKAVKMAHAKGDRPLRLNKDSWNLVCSGGGSLEAYNAGLRGAEAAVAAEPNNPIFLNTLGVAQYRTERYEEAYATLTRCDELRRQQRDADWPRDVAVLAMALFKLERIDEARAMLRHVEELTYISDLRNPYSQAASAMFKECEELLEGSDAQPEPLENTEGDK